jgi:hypothetical protein
MQFDPNNEIVQLCAAGMQLEGEGKPAEAAANFRQAWDAAANDLEKFIAAHYLARHQPSVQEKLQWDQTALYHALQLDDSKPMLPSLYLNVAKGYEDLNEHAKAAGNYQLASSFTQYLSNDGYGNMIKAGIEKGMATHRKRGLE